MRVPFVLEPILLTPATPMHCERMSSRSTFTISGYCVHSRCPRWSGSPRLCLVNATLTASSSHRPAHHVCSIHRPRSCPQTEPTEREPRVARSSSAFLNLLLFRRCSKRRISRPKKLGCGYTRTSTCIHLSMKIQHSSRKWQNLPPASWTCRQRFVVSMEATMMADRDMLTKTS